jgi:hypothetical protein
VKRAWREIAIALPIGLLFTGCAGWLRWPWGRTQRWPSPMEQSVDPLPPGEAHLFEEGPEEVLVLRHADPVKVRPTGMTAGYPLTFYNKSVRVHAGSGLWSAPGGRIEVLWPNGNSIVLFDGGGGVIGSPSRGQSSFIFLFVDRARIELNEPDQIELVGGARLSARSGPYVIDHVRREVLRVSNQSKLAGEIAYRDAVFTIDPGQMIDLALIGAGGKPIQSDPGLQSLQGPGFGVRYSGAVQIEDQQNSVALRALGEHEIQALGVRVRLERDESVRFEGLGPK